MTTVVFFNRLRSLAFGGFLAIGLGAHAQLSDPAPSHPAKAASHGAIYAGLQLMSADTRAGRLPLDEPQSAPSVSLSDDERRFIVCAAASSLQGRWAQEQWFKARKQPVNQQGRATESSATGSGEASLSAEGSAPYWREVSTDAARTFWIYQNVLTQTLGAQRLQQELTTQRKHLQHRLHRQELAHTQLREVSSACQRLSLSWIARGLVSAQDAQNARSFAWQAWDQGVSEPASSSGTPNNAPATAVSQGSAFVIAPGYLLTNAHVVRGASKIWLQNGPERVPAELVDMAPSADLALLKADVRSPALKLQLAQAPRLGEPVVALGYPMADTLGYHQKATFGRVSADNPELPLVQLDMQVQPGFSGAPLLDELGQVVGVVTGALDQRKSLASLGVTASNVAFSARLGASGPWLRPRLLADGSRGASGSNRAVAGSSFQQVLQQARASVYLVEALP